MSFEGERSKIELKRENLIGLSKFKKAKLTVLVPEAFLCCLHKIG